MGPRRPTLPWAPTRPATLPPRPPRGSGRALRAAAAAEHSAASAASAAAAEHSAAAAAADASLLALVGRLAAALADSDLTELEVEAGETALLLRKPGPAPIVIGVTAPAAPGVTAAPNATAAAPAPDGGPAAPAAAGASARAASGAHSTAAPERLAGHAGRLVVAAPLTGVWYASASPGSPPFVAVGSEIAVGHVIGLIEAMKLFNEIKSDRAGRVVRVVPENGALVRAKQPLIEVEPL